MIEAIAALALIAALVWIGGAVLDRTHKCSFGQRDNCPICGKTRPY